MHLFFGAAFRSGDALVACLPSPRGPRRAAFSSTLLLLLSACWLFPPAHLSAQLPIQTQTLAANRALVSTGPPALPPTSPAVRPPVPPDIIPAITVQRPPAPPLNLISKRGIFDLLAVNPGELVQVTVNYPVTKTGRLIKAEALDGGQLVLPVAPLLVGADGAIRFQFRAASAPGINHIALRDGTHELGLQFWVLDAQHPERKPPVVN